MQTRTVNYVENFLIPGVGSYAISKKTNFKGSSTFCPWEGGCAIHPAFNSIDEARAYIFNHAKNHIEKSMQLFEMKMQALKDADEKLHGDVFNLACFKTQS